MSSQQKKIPTRIYLKLKWIASLILFSFSAFPSLSASSIQLSSDDSNSNQNYCLALRGNGELAPAHWGALARAVEVMGFPVAMSGGSSASITLFLLESIAINPEVQSVADPQVKNARASLLIKSLQGFLQFIEEDNLQLKTLKNIAHYLKMSLDSAKGNQTLDLKVQAQKLAQLSDGSFLKTYESNKEKIHAALIFAKDNLPFINPELLDPLQHALNDLDVILEKEPPHSKSELSLVQKRVQFYANEIFVSLEKFGSFDSLGDDNLFFRPGLLNFSYLADSFGKVANFYAGIGMEEGTQKKLQTFLNTCASPALDSTWDELIRNFTSLSCDVLFKQILSTYFSKNPSLKSSREMDTIGRFIPAFISTAVFSGKNAYQRIEDAFLSYKQSMTLTFGHDFQFPSQDLKFGYWGPADQLQKISDNLKRPFPVNRSIEEYGHQKIWDFSADKKSSLFLPLGPTNWKTAMSLSPAEPGLANLQPFQKNDDEKLYSAGGWADLSPGAVLKAYGCEQVIYITRRGGESLFAQGTAKRLFGFNEIPPDRLDTVTRDEQKKIQIKKANNNGDPVDQTSFWSQLYNLANPTSSFNTALNLFDATICTNWNAYSIKNPGSVSDLILDAYKAPWTFISNSSLAAKLKKQKLSVVTSAENQFDSALGYRPYAGCLPF